MRLWSWILVDKLGLVNIWSLGLVEMLMFGWDFEDEIWSIFVFELVIWTQSSGPLCLWQCSSFKPNQHDRILFYAPNSQELRRKPLAIVKKEDYSIFNHCSHNMKLYWSELRRRSSALFLGQQQWSDTDPSSWPSWPPHHTSSQLHILDHWF